MDRDHPDFITALDRGLLVIQTFDADHRRLTLTQIAARTGLSRGTTRRFLLTLAELGFVASDGKLFWLTARVMRLGYSFLSSMGLVEIAQPIVRSLSLRLDESCSFGVLDGEEVVYVSRTEARRVYRSAVSIGSRLPAHATSLGRVLLSALSPADLDVFLRKASIVAFTARTTTDRAALGHAIARVRKGGFAIVDNELQVGIRSVAVPVQDGGGRIVGALNIGALTPATSLATMRKDYVPLLQTAAAEITASTKLLLT